MQDDMAEGYMEAKLITPWQPERRVKPETRKGDMFFQIMPPVTASPGQIPPPNSSQL